MIGLVVGLLGLGGSVLPLPSGTRSPLAVVAGAIALVTGVAVVRLVGRLRNANATGSTSSRTRSTSWPSQVEKETEARTDLETKLANRIQLTSVRRNSSGDALTDGATGLFSEGYFTVALDARIAAARRQLEPVAVVLMEVIEGLESGLPRPANPKAVAECITRHDPRGRHGLPPARRRLRPRPRGHRRERRDLDRRAHPPPHHRRGAPG